MSARSAIAAALTAAVLIGSGAIAMAAPPLGPGATLRQKNEALAARLRGPASEQQPKELHALAATLIDYPAFARAAFSEHWDTVKKRDELVAAFRQMLESRYIKELRARLDAPVVYAQEEIDGPEATVTTIVQINAKGRNTEEEIVYKLRKVDGTWRVRDIIDDEISLVRNYKTQFHKIITEQGADRLLEKMKAKQ
jgi:phospholipid transport system substrate-binding protein